MPSIDMKSPGDHAEEPLALRGGVGHRPDVHGSATSAHVDRAEIDFRAAGHAAVHQALHHQDRRRVVGSEHGSEHADRVDDGELELVALARDEVPRSALGERLGLRVRDDIAARRIGPAGLVERRGLRRMTVADRGERRCQDDALDLGIARRTQHAQRTLTRRHDQLVLVLRHGLGERRRDVQHVLTAGDGLRPAIVALEIGGERNASRSPGSAPPSRNSARTSASRLRLPDGRPGLHLMACREQLRDAMTADESGSAGDEDVAHHGRAPHSVAPMPSPRRLGCTENRKSSLMGAPPFGRARAHAMKTRTRLYGGIASLMGAPPVQSRTCHRLEDSPVQRFAALMGAPPFGRAHAIASKTRL